MPEMNGNETPVSQTAGKRNERTEAKFFENVEKIIAEAEQLDKLVYTDYDSLMNACISAKGYIKSKYGTRSTLSKHRQNAI